MNVIFHLNELRRFDHCYANVKNLLKEDEVNEIHILMNGEPVTLAIVDQEPRIVELIELGIVVSVCQNALNANDILTSELEDTVNVVPTGVFELMKRQEQGYSYIKP
ncbi:DsrE family protein [Erysipelothrix urinaevulpis]|uniref:DsrE family protein n=1 Tax=Erysipelothrix urinaevulpis TaxID=2683717 RepID=UPI00135B42F1|nr:DsrE family protein [Erysipelothrix urinaevulpis]